MIAFDLNHDESAVDRLRHHAISAPDSLAAAFLDDDLEIVQSWTFAELDRRARSMAAFLQTRCVRGDRVVLAYPTCLDFLSAFYGCLYAGVLAVPTSLPLAHGKDRRLALIVADSGAQIALTTTKYVDLIQRQLPVTGSDTRVEILATDNLPNMADGWRQHRAEPGHLAFLQYTSGSTRSPAGVMVSHANLSANLDALGAGFGASSDSVCISWLPLFHDMGLVAGVLEPTWVGCPVYLMPPVRFAQNPLRWLRAFTRYRGTIGGGPNFAFQACVEAARAQGVDGLDLSSWTLAWNGAEPVRSSTIAEFCATFRSVGFRPEAMTPAFGLAEATLLVTWQLGDTPPTVRAIDETALRRNKVVLADEDPRGKNLVSSGNAARGLELRVVDADTGIEVADSTVGEIWVRGNSVGTGYWGKPEQSASVFEARTAAGEGPFLRTGDLGFLHGGELFVTGRRKDVIVIRGVNYYPQDIEQTIENSHPALQPTACAVLGIDDGNAVRVVVVQELRRRNWRSVDPAEIFVAIRREVAREHQLAVHRIVLLKAFGLPKTSSGKVQRSACRAALDDGTLGVLHEWRATLSAAPIDFTGEPLTQPGVLERQLVDWLQRECGIDGITWKTPLMDLGIDSLKGVELGNALSAAFEHSFPVTVMIEHPTIESLARLIREEVLSVTPEEHADPPVTHGESLLAQDIDSLDDAELDMLLEQSINAVLKRDERP